MSQEKHTSESAAAHLAAFALHTADNLRGVQRVRVIWLTGSLAVGTADAASDVDLRAAIRAEDFATIDEWRRRWPGEPDEAILSAITTDHLRFDLVAQSAADTMPRTLEAARVLCDKDGVAERIVPTAPSSADPLRPLPYVVEEFIRLIGMLPIVVAQDDVPMGMITGKRHVAALLDGEQRAVLASVPTLAPTMASVIEGRLAYARCFLPRARRLMAAHGLAYPEAFEAATRQHLLEMLGVSL
jgi:hypothetical protein